MRIGNLMKNLHKKSLDAKETKQDYWIKLQHSYQNQGSLINTKHSGTKFKCYQQEQQQQLICEAISYHFTAIATTTCAVT